MQINMAHEQNAQRCVLQGPYQQRTGLQLARSIFSLGSRAILQSQKGLSSQACRAWARDCNGIMQLQHPLDRAYGTICKLKPKFQGGKLKLGGAYKRRFKRLSDDSIKLFPAGHRHRRFRKNKRQNLRLRTPNKMHSTYANTMKRMGFK